MVERINARNDTARAMTENEHRQTGIFGFRGSDKRRHVVSIIFHLFNVVTLTFGTPAPAQIDRISRQTFRRELLADPKILPAMRIKPGDDYDHAACFPFGLPRASKNFQSADSFES